VTAIWTDIGSLLPMGSREEIDRFARLKLMADRVPHGGRDPFI